MNGGGGGNTFDVQGTAAGASTTIAAGTVGDTFDVGSTTNSLDGIAGALGERPGGRGALNLDDQGSGASHTETITRRPSGRSGAATITYSCFPFADRERRNGGQHLHDSKASAGMLVTIAGGAGTNTLVGPNSANTWDITGMNAGTLNGAPLLSTVRFSSIRSLTGGTGADTFKLENGQGVTGNIDGGGAGTIPSTTRRTLPT